jgi:glutaredoxin-like YruB-family protein
MKKVTIYSTPTCHYCNLAKEYFNENKVKYDSFDVASDLDKRREMMEKSGQLGVPVIVIDGEVVVGFDRSRIANLLQIK